MDDQLSEQAKANVVFGLLTGRQCGRYTYYVGQRVRTAYDHGLYGDHVSAGVIRGFKVFPQPYLSAPSIQAAAIVELDDEPFLLGGHGKYCVVFLPKLIPID